MGTLEPQTTRRPRTRASRRATVSYVDSISQGMPTFLGFLLLTVCGSRVFLSRVVCGVLLIIDPGQVVWSTECFGRRPERSARTERNLWTLLLLGRMAGPDRLERHFYVEGRAWQPYGSTVGVTPRSVHPTRTGPDGRVEWWMDGWRLTDG